MIFHEDKCTFYRAFRLILIQVNFKNKRDDLMLLSKLQSVMIDKIMNMRITTMILGILKGGHADRQGVSFFVLNVMEYMGYLKVDE